MEGIKNDSQVLATVVPLPKIKKTGEVGRGQIGRSSKEYTGAASRWGCLGGRWNFWSKAWESHLGWR